MRKLIISLLPDVLMVAGAAVISYGAWLIYSPAGFLVGGGFALVAGILQARVSGK